MEDKHPVEAAEAPDVGSTLMDILVCLGGVEKRMDSLAEKCASLTSQWGSTQARMANMEAKVNRLVAAAMRSEAGSPRYVHA